MDKKSDRKNNFLYKARKAEKLSLDKASKRCGISLSKLQRMENDQQKTYIPHDILSVAEGYNNPYLCIYYCSKICPIGMEMSVKYDEINRNASNIILNIINSVNMLKTKEKTLVRIFDDEKVDADERKDLEVILKELNLLETQIESLQLWDKKQNP